jgi:hypothetical protein
MYTNENNSNYLISKNRIGGVMVSVVGSSEVDRGFEPWSGQTKDYKIGICSFSANHAASSVEIILAFVVATMGQIIF